MSAWLTRLFNSTSSSDRVSTEAVERYYRHGDNRVCRCQVWRANLGLRAAGNLDKCERLAWIHCSGCTLELDNPIISVCASSTAGT